MFWWYAVVVVNCLFMVAGDKKTTAKPNKAKIRTFQNANEFKILVKMERVSPIPQQPDSVSGVQIGEPVAFLMNVTFYRRHKYLLYPQDCYGTAQPNGALRYYILKDRCPTDIQDTKISNVTGQSMVLTFLAFSFATVGTSGVYLTCEVLVCRLEEANTNACSFCAENSRKRKRRAVEQLDDQNKAKLSSGPITIIQDKKEDTRTTDGQRWKNNYHESDCDLLPVLYISLILMVMTCLVKQTLDHFRMSTYLKAEITGNDGKVEQSVMTELYNKRLYYG